MAPVRATSAVFKKEGHMETQNNLILGDLLEGKIVSPLGALNDHGCFRLSARIYDLRKEGYPIESKYEEVGRQGKRIKVYWIDLEKLAQRGFNVNKRLGSGGH